MKRLVLALLALCALLVPAAHAAGDDGTRHAVYTLTNSPAGNAVVAFARGTDGSLAPAGTYPTGGLGGPLGSGHAIVVSHDGRWIAGVNAGSDSVSVFEARHHALDLVATVPSGGDRPSSVTINGDLVYVLNADSLSIAGFRISGGGLTPVPGSIRPLGAGAAVPSQIQFDATGHVLVVDSRGSSTFDTFVVDATGAAGPARTTPASAAAPFGFDVDRAGRLLTSNANLGDGSSGASSYDVAVDGTLTPNGGGVSSGQAAACWLAAARRWAYTTNAGSGSIGRFDVAADGTLALGGTFALGAGAHPLDEDVSIDERYLYVLVDGFHRIAGFEVGPDGGLTEVASADVPAGAGGLAAS